MAAAASAAVRVLSGNSRGSMMMPRASAAATTAATFGCMSGQPARIDAVRDWLVASGIIEGPEGVLLVQNRRRNGALDWSTPGGVIEVHEGESVVDGWTREVAEETGIVVEAWEGPVYEVEALAEGLGWHLRAEVHRALGFSGELQLDDPDGTVADARF